MPAERLARLRRLIAEAGYDAVVAMSPDNVTYAAGFTVSSQRWSRRRLVMAVVLPEGPTQGVGEISSRQSPCRSPGRPMQQRPRKSR